MTSATERILALAAYLDRHRRDEVTLDDIYRDVPGYRPDGAPTHLVKDSPPWEAARKKLRRDLEDLRREWGIVVDYDEADGCYRIARPFFTAAERAALISAAGVVAVQGLHRGDAGAIGMHVDDRTSSVVIRVHALVADFRDAIATRTPLRFEHEGRVRVLEPWALGVWRNRWYVAGGDPAHGHEMRRFRLDRIETPPDGPPLEAAGDPGSYTVPDWFDPEKAFDFDPNSWGHDAPLVARVRVGADHASAFCREFGGEIVARHADHVDVELVVRHYESFRNRLLGFRQHAVVQAPPELVDMVRAHLVAIAASTPTEAG
jgi:predicted DNA-binding transcriptional regulator YafY